jgi:hypothetical protein
MRAGVVNVVDQRACAWRRLSQKGAGGRWAWAREASAGRARRRARGSGRCESARCCRRVREDEGNWRGQTNLPGWR